MVVGWVWLDGVGVEVWLSRWVWFECGYRLGLVGEGLWLEW